MHFNKNWHRIKFEWINLMSTIPLHFTVKLQGSRKFEWMENYTDSTWHKVDNISTFTTLNIILVSYDILCQFGNFSNDASFE